MIIWVKIFQIYFSGSLEAVLSRRVSFWCRSPEEAYYMMILGIRGGVHEGVGERVDEGFFVTDDVGVVDGG